LKRKGLNIKKTLLNEQEMEKVINRMVHEIIEKVGDLEHLAIVGIRTRGVSVADRIVRKINEFEKTKVMSGSIDISLYRDDFFKSLASPAIGPTKLDFKIDNYNIVLVDDVLYTGRTIRAAIDAVMDYGRPRSIKLAVLVDRGCRELPIQPDFMGISVQTSKEEAVAVFLKETDGEDKVVIGEK